MRRGAPAAAGAVLAAALLAACSSASGADPQTPELWRTQIDRVLQGDASEVTETHRAILADYVVTEAEYGELKQDLSDCLSAHGVEHELDPAHGGTLDTQELPGDDDGSQTLELTTACLDATTGPVESIYLGMQENPEGLSRGEALRRCLDAAGASEFSGVSADDLEHRLAAGELVPSTPEAKLCEVDPFGTLGLTLDDARRYLSEDGSAVAAE